jgi:hypothetical protein
MQECTGACQFCKEETNIAWEVGFDAGRVISAIPDTEEQMKRFAFLPFYRRIKQEGVSA